MKVAHPGQERLILEELRRLRARVSYEHLHASWYQSMTWLQWRSQISGASHVILPMSALHDDKFVKQVNLRLAAGEINAMEAHREIFPEHVTIPLCPLGRVIRKLQWIIAMPIKGGTVLTTTVPDCNSRKTRVTNGCQCCGFWAESPPPDMSKCSLQHLNSRGQDSTWTRVVTDDPTSYQLERVIFLTKPSSDIWLHAYWAYTPQSVVKVDSGKQVWLKLLQMIASHRPTHLQHDYTIILLQVGDVVTVRSLPTCGKWLDHSDWQV